MVGTAGSNHSGFSGDLGWKPCLSPTFACQSLEFCEECGLTIWVRKAFGLELKKSLAELLLFHSLTEHMAHLCSPHETILRMCSEEKENKKWYAYARLFVLLSMCLIMSYLCSTANPRRTSFTGGFQSCSKSDCCFRKNPLCTTNMACEFDCPLNKDCPENAGWPSKSDVSSDKKHLAGRLSSNKLKKWNLHAEKKAFMWKSTHV